MVSPSKAIMLENFVSSQKGCSRGNALRFFLENVKITQKSVFFKIDFWWVFLTCLGLRFYEIQKKSSSVSAGTTFLKKVLKNSKNTQKNLTGTFALFFGGGRIFFSICWDFLESCVRKNFLQSSKIRQIHSGNWVFRHGK